MRVMAKLQAERETARSITPILGTSSSITASNLFYKPKPDMPDRDPGDHQPKK
jgi:hypothetical protein